MRNVLMKEMRLAASPLSFFFILFGLMFFLPGYPILCGPFFVTLGLYQSFQNTRETGDIVFSALLPIAKQDVVKGKYFFVCMIEAVSFVLMAFATLLRMTVFSKAAVYRQNALMNANPFALGMALVIFGLFHLTFIDGFFQTAQKLGKPFVIHTIVTFLVIGAAETLHHIPGMEALNAFGFEHIGLQCLLLCLGVLLYLTLTAVSIKKSCASFEQIDL